MLPSKLQSTERLLKWALITFSVSTQPSLVQSQHCNAVGELAPVTRDMFLFAQPDMPQLWAVLA